MLQQRQTAPTEWKPTRGIAAREMGMDDHWACADNRQVGRLAISLQESEGVEDEIYPSVERPGLERLDGDR